jgi:predicted regulator of Ras-like GTPase activity (Roadblock/LC7/MglB family)
MARSASQKPRDTYEHIDHEEELLGSYLARLQKVKGYKASAVMTFRGEILASHSAEANIDLRGVGKTFNDIFRSAHEASDKIGLQLCLEMVINTPNGIIIMRCSGVEVQVHFHLLVIVAADGNLALAKLELEKLVTLVLAEIS